MEKILGRHLMAININVIIRIVLSNRSTSKTIAVGKAISNGARGKDLVEGNHSSKESNMPTSKATGIIKRKSSRQFRFSFITSF